MAADPVPRPHGDAIDSYIGAAMCILRPPLAAANLLLATLLSAGCATADAPPVAAESALPAASRYPYSVCVATRGGTGSVANGRGLSDPEFRAAIENSIKDSKVFREVMPRDGQYQLNAEVVLIRKPVFGSHFTVTLETGWTLVRSNDKRVVWRQSIRSQHTTTMADAFVGAQRLQLAVEGAARKNIEQALREIGQARVAHAGSLASAQ